jgi:hypothetical protein
LEKSTTIGINPANRTSSSHDVSNMSESSQGSRERREIAKTAQKKEARLIDLQCTFDCLGGSDLVIDILMKTDLAEKLFKEAVYLGIALLEAGNSQVQVSLFL